MTWLSSRFIWQLHTKEIFSLSNVPDSENKNSEQEKLTGQPEQAPDNVGSAAGVDVQNDQLVAQ